MFTDFGVAQKHLAADFKYFAKIIFNIHCNIPSANKTMKNIIIVIAEERAARV